MSDHHEPDTPSKRYIGRKTLEGAEVVEGLYRNYVAKAFARPLEEMPEDVEVAARVTFLAGALSVLNHAEASPGELLPMAWGASMLADKAADDYSRITAARNAAAEMVEEALMRPLEVLEEGGEG
jgi:hypothetical protein